MQTVYESGLDTLRELETLIPSWEVYNDSINQKLKEQERITRISVQSDIDIRNLVLSINELTKYYNGERDKTVEELERRITETVNLWFDNSYNFKFVPETKTGPRGLKGDNNNVYYRLVDTIRGGRISLVCGGGCQQTLGVLLSITLNEVTNSGFIFFDECFNSFGAREIERVPELLTKVVDSGTQSIIVEHEHEHMLLPQDKCVIFNVSRSKNMSSVVDYDATHPLLQETISEINNLDITQRDVDILLKFRIPFENSLKSEEYKQVYNMYYGGEKK